MKGRIISVYKDLYKVSVEVKNLVDNNDKEENMGSRREFNSSITGNMIKSNNFPVVGDYVEISNENQIVDIYPRKTVLSRKVSGKKIKEQPIVSNVDYIFIVTSLNKDFNISRLERYLTMVYDSGASPCFILTKADLDDGITNKVNELEGIAFGVPIHIVSSYENQGIDEVKGYLKDNKTIGLIGSSGVGKSTLINKIIGEDILRGRP